MNTHIDEATGFTLYSEMPPIKPGHCIWMSYARGPRYYFYIKGLTRFSHDIKIVPASRMYRPEKKRKVNVPVECSDAGRRESGFGHERNDCTVRAMAAGLGVEYPVMHAFMTKYGGRKKGKGLNFRMFMRENKDRLQKEFNVALYEGPEIEYKKTFGNVFKATMTLKKPKHSTINRLLKADPNGTYIVCVNAHLTCVKNGKVVDTAAGNWHIKHYWQVLPLYSTDASIQK